MTEHDTDTDDEMNRWPTADAWVHVDHDGTVSAGGNADD